MIKIRQRLLRAGRRQRGAAAMEFAFVLPVLVMILYGLVTFGEVFYTQMTLSRVAADGARSLGFVRDLDTGASIPEPVQASVRTEVISSLALSILSGKLGGSYADRVTWLEANVAPQVTVDNGACAGEADPNGNLRVRVVYPYSNARILPVINLPMMGELGSWMPNTLVGCAIAQR